MLEANVGSGKSFRVVVRLALNYAINHTQNSFEKTVFQGLADSIDRAEPTILCEVVVLKQILKFGLIFTRFTTEETEFIKLSTELIYEKEILITV